MNTRSVSLLDSSALRPVIQDADYVFHIAGVTKAKTKQEYSIGNVATTQNLLEACLSNRRLQKFCLVSSLTAAGPSGDGTPLVESDPCKPITAYGRSKREAEILCEQMTDRIPIVILRPPTVYGPRDQDILQLFKWVKFGIAPQMGPRHKRLSIIHAVDLARGIVDATISDKTLGHTYFISNRESHEYSSLLDYAGSILNKQLSSIRIPSFFMYTLAGVSQAIHSFSKKAPVLNLDKVRDLVSPYWTCSTEKIFSDIGFESKITIDDGFRSTIDWYRNRGWL